ncbi:hypothetical protein KBI23_23665 [bacterium]|nr:hypothetical protein [bacterium]MBP9810200.1 hypothetical protein [bacterium]
MAANISSKTTSYHVNGKALLRLILVFSSLVLLGGSLAPSACAEAAPLAQLEEHFFQHTYPADSEDDRLTRIEKLVFGEAKTGDSATRISDLQKVVTEADTSPSTPSNQSNSTAQSASGTQSDSDTSASDSNNNSAASNNSTNSADSIALAGTDYPRVDELEQLILNQSFKQLPLSKRLSQLEIKAFGKPSNDDDLSARTDALEVHWEKTLSPGLEKQYLCTVEWLENKVIGQTYSSKPLIERVQTLEGIVFPNQPPDTTNGIKEQLETLTNAVHINKNSSPDVTPMASSDRNQQPHTYPGLPAQSQYTAQGQYPQAPPYPNSYQNQAPSQSGYGTNSVNTYSQQSFQMPSAENLQGAQNYQQPYQQTQGYQQTQVYQPAQNYQQSQPTQQYSQTGQATENASGASEQQAAQSKGHPLLKGLAKALGAAATMAAGAMSSGMMNMNFGNGMYGNGMYGNSLYSGGYGGYNGYNTGYGGYGGTNIRF